MCDYVESLKKEAARNGRECAEALRLFVEPENWSSEAYCAALDQLAVALMETFPGGLANFQMFAPAVIPAARDAFNSRLADLGLKTYPQDAKAGALTISLDPARDGGCLIERVTGWSGTQADKQPSAGPATEPDAKRKGRAYGSQR